MMKYKMVTKNMGHVGVEYELYTFGKNLPLAVKNLSNTGKMKEIQEKLTINTHRKMAPVTNTVPLSGFLKYSLVSIFI
ncbi:MAG: hypothetical protein LBD78_08355 [Spirochaetaceae bacterium]|jgi:hypothetical protein|nr:hypothetical protein [Spirochaetaceae bacterium]